MTTRPPLAALIGPTAAGKSKMAVEVAAELGAEIVSCDSMAVYRGLDVLAAKPSAKQREAVRHHLLDVVDSSEEITAVQYRDLARAAVADVTDRGNLALLSGGSGLWFRSIVDDLEFAPTEPDVRARLASEDPADLYAKLMKVDPASSEYLDVRNPRRIVRAMEIHEITGRPPSELRKSWQTYDGPYNLVVVGLTWDRPELYSRVETRIAGQLEAGLEAEVRQARGSGLSQTAAQALGVKEMIALIDGECDASAAVSDMVAATKRFIRRQMSWFRADPRVVWVNVSDLGWDGARSRILEEFGPLTAD